MKVIAFNGSPRTNGNTNRALEIVLEEIAKEGIETELVQMGSEDISPCQACGVCGQKKDRKCKRKDDKVNEWVEKMAAADGIIIGSPVYFGSMNAQTKAFIDRIGYVNRANGDLFKRKVGASVAVNRRAGALADLPGDEQLLPHRPDDRGRLVVLERAHRPSAGGRGEGRGRPADHEGPGQEHGLGHEEARLAPDQSLLATGHLQQGKDG